MNLNGNTGVDERADWRAKIMRALQELRGADDSMRVGRARNDANGEDAAPGSTSR